VYGAGVKAVSKGFSEERLRSNRRQPMLVGWAEIGMYKI
jgi:hypothetical protein